MACDLQVTYRESGFKTKVKTKVFEISNPVFQKKPFLIGYAGNLDVVPGILEFLATFDGNSKTPKFKNTSTEFLVLTSDKKIYTFTDPTSWILIDTPYHAIGSGAMFAMGAMAMKATPEQAVKVASNHDTYTGSGIRVITFEK